MARRCSDSGKPWNTLHGMSLANLSPQGLRKPTEEEAGRILRAKFHGQHQENKAL